MIGNSLLDYITIRLSIGSLRIIAPASICYLGCCVINRRWLSIPIALWTAAEAVFYLFIYLPRRSRLQAPPSHSPPSLTPTQRRLIFDRCILSATASGSAYPTGWFFPSTTTPNREDAVDWLLWALFSSSREEMDNLDEYKEELDGYIEDIQRILGEKLKEGHSTDLGLRSMRITLDPVLMLHRPLVWYLIVCLVDTYTSLFLLYLGFQHYTPRDSQWRRTFPPRPVLSFVTRPAPEGVVTPYWYLPHRSTSIHPVVFLHGIGIGLYPYIPFIRSLMSSSDAGILLPEVLPICMHMTPRSVPPRPQMLASMNIILESLRHKEVSNLESSPLLGGNPGEQERTGWNRIVLASHSYGTFIAGWVVRDCVDTDIVENPTGESGALSHKIAHLVLVDPIPILLSNPAVAHNFLYRHPTAVCPRQLGSVSPPWSSTLDIEPNIDPPLQFVRAKHTKPSSYSSASAWQLWYFASRDADIARTLYRAFFWTEGGIWREEIAEFIAGDITKSKRGRNMAVVLGGMDQIVPSEAIRKYLTREERWSESWSGTRLNGDVSTLGVDGEELEESDVAKGSLGASRIGYGSNIWVETRAQALGVRDDHGEGQLDVLFNPVLDHAVIFDDPRWTKDLLDVVCRYVRDV